MPYTIRKYKSGYRVCKVDKPSKCFSKNPLTKTTAVRQMRAILMNEHKNMEGGLKPLTARIGGKVLLKKILVNEYFPDPESYSTYVEPFVGGGSVYFYKNKDGKKEVVNDIDPDIYTIFKGFQKYEGKKLAEDLNGDYTTEDFKKIKASNPKNEYNKFLKTYLMYRLSYFGRGISFGKTRISSKFEGYKDRLYNVDILKSDYKEVIKKYNTASTFFYLDPPAVESTGSYRFSPINAQELVPVLKSIKGKFCLSFANTSIKKELFKGFNIYTVSTKYVGEKTKGGQTKKTKEYIITNYVPPNIGRKSGGSMDRVIGGNMDRVIGGCSTCHLKGLGAPHNEKLVIEIENDNPKKCGGCMGKCGGSMVKFHKQLKEIGMTHNMYMAKAKELAESQGYDPSKLDMSEDEDHKLVYHSPDGDRYFGKVSYADYIIWTWLEHKGEVPEGTADKRRMAYRARATKIKGNWKKDKYSPNNLAINILW